MVEIKMVKFSDDLCFGEKYDGIEQCMACWVKKSCHGNFKANLRAKLKLETC